MADVVTSENRAEFMAQRVKVRAEPKEELKPAEEPKPVEEKPAEAKQHPIKERFSEIAAARRLAEQREQEARDEARRYREELDALKAQKAPQAASKPEAKDFQDMAAYAEALSDWKVVEKLKEKAEEDKKAAQKAESERLARSWQSKVRKVSEEIDDYDEVMSAANLPITQEIGIALLKSDIGPRIQYYLAQHPAELEELRELPTDDMLRRLGKLEAKLEKPAATVVVDKKSAEREESKPIRKIQEPPEPITPLNGVSVVAGSGIVDADGNVTGSYRDYKAARKAGKIK